MWVESESNRIGNVYLPPKLWTVLRAASGYRIHVSTDARVQHLLVEYAHLVADSESLKRILNALRTRHGTSPIEAWIQKIDTGEWHEFVASLLAIHYDPAYGKSSSRCYPNVSQKIPMRDVSPEAVDELVTVLLAAL